MPQSGGDYAYITEALGRLPGFLFLWCAVIVLMPTGIAIASLTFAYYILQPVFPSCEPPEFAVWLIAATAICEQLLLFHCVVLRSKNDTHFIIVKKLHYIF